MQSVQSHLPSNLGMRDLVSFRNFLKLMVQQHWITEASPTEKPDTEDGQLQLSLSAQDQVLNLSKILAATVAGDQSKLASLTEELEPCDGSHMAMLGCIQSPIQRMPSRALDGSQRLTAWALSSKRSSGSAGVQRASSSYCPAAAVGGFSGAQILNSVDSALTRHCTAKLNGSVTRRQR